MPTFRNALFRLHRYEGWLGLRMLKYLYGKRFGWGYFLAIPFSRINTPTFSNLVILHTYLPLKMGQSVPRRHKKFQTPGNRPEEGIQHSEQGESFKSRMWLCAACVAHRYLGVKECSHLAQTQCLRLGGGKPSRVTKVFGGCSNSKQQKNSTRIQVWVFRRQESHVTCTTCNVELVRFKEPKLWHGGCF